MSATAVESRFFDLEGVRFSNSNFEVDVTNFFKKKKITNLAMLLKNSKGKVEVCTDTITHIAPTDTIREKWKQLGNGVIYKREYYIMEELVSRNIWIKLEEESDKWRLVVKIVKNRSSNLAIDKYQCDIPIDVNIGSISVYAKFLTKRKIFVPIDQQIQARIHWDHVSFIDASEYSVFTIVGELYDIDNSLPKRSKVVECLSKTRINLYNELVNLNIVAGVKYSNTNKFMPGKDPKYEDWISKTTVNRLLFQKPEWNDDQFERFNDFFQECETAWQSLKNPTSRLGVCKLLTLANYT
eukprot:NODE_221_length_13987_cov_0.244888.p4 type:complete len:297 gc:universal NODE_221_length_13987_cov_0.244888:13285-12395(-)